MEKLWWVARVDFTASFLALIVTSKIHRVPCFSAAVTTTTRMSTSQEWVKVSTLGWSRYKLWQSIWQSATLQTALKACFHFVTFAALDTLSLPSTWTETWASLAIEYCWGSWDLCFLCLWGKPLISCFVRSSLKLIFSCFLWPRVAPWNYFKTNLLKMAMFKKKKIKCSGTTCNKSNLWNKKNEVDWLGQCPSCKRCKHIHHTRLLNIKITPVLIICASTRNCQNKHLFLSRNGLAIFITTW